MRQNLLLSVMALTCTVAVGCPAVRHTTQIDRNFASIFEGNLIARAEAVCPDRDAVLEVYGFFDDDPDLPSEDVCLWWHDVFDGVRIAYAITDEAVAYYADVAADIRDDGRFGPEFLRWRSSRLQYTAGVRFAQDYVSPTAIYFDVYVVEMELSWSATCGFVCAHGFTRQRTVVFDDEGNMLEVIGDGPARLFVS